MEPIRVLHLIQASGTGGYEQYVTTLLKTLQGKGVEFELAYGQEGTLTELARKMGLPVHPLPMESPWDQTAAKALAKFCRERKIDTVHTHFLRENYVAAFSKLHGNKARLVNTIHMLEPKSKAVLAMNRIMYRLVDGIIAVSGAVKDMAIREGLQARKLQIVYSGVLTRPCAADEIAAERKRLGIEEGETVFTSIARFREEKGHAFALKAAEAFYRKRPEARVRFVLAGDGALLEPMREAAKSLGGKVILPGLCTDPALLLQASDVLLSHSEQEAFGLSIVEGIQCGLPAVATDAGGPREILGGAAPCGVLVPKGDAEGYADALIRLLEDEDFRGGLVANLPAAQARFSVEQMAADTLRQYRGQLG
ncbi:MAG: glycosyltransferase [Firmicutes bacterium]|nr:glycosyltransferase [Bacillota bacterium]